jgi:hypothetical protein
VRFFFAVRFFFNVFFFSILCCAVLPYLQCAFSPVAFADVCCFLAADSVIARPCSPRCESHGRVKSGPCCDAIPACCRQSSAAMMF